MPRYLIKNPDTGNVVAELDPDANHCSGGDSLCGGCDACMLQQAEFSGGWKIEEIMKSGIELIADERNRQINEEGWTPSHDDTHTNGELAMAACCYAAPRRLYEFRLVGPNRSPHFADPWPWEGWDKRKAFRNGNWPLWPEEMTAEQRLDLLVKAGALIAAEIDRLIRVSP